MVANRLDLVFIPSEEGWVDGANDNSRLGVAVHWFHSNLDLDSRNVVQDS